MDFEKIRKEALDNIAKKEMELSAMKDALKDKEAELEKFREATLLNLMHHDKNAIQEEEEEPEKECESPFTFLGETPPVKELEEMKSIVIHFKPFEGEKDEMEPDNVHVAVECGVGDEDAIGALLLAYVMAVGKSVLAEAKNDEEQEEIKKMFAPEKVKRIAAYLLDETDKAIIAADVADNFDEVLSKLADLLSD